MSEGNDRGGAFEEIVSAIDEGRAALHGRIPLVRRTVRLPDPPPVFSPRKIRRLRKGLGMSQAVFARTMAVSPVTLQKWEQGTQSPSLQARRLLEFAEHHPQVFLGRLAAKPVRAGTR